MVKGERFRIMYKRPGRTEIVRHDMIMPSRKELMKYLDEKEGISAATTDELVVHQIKKDGTVVEFYSWSKSGSAGKPVIRLENTPTEPKKVAEAKTFGYVAGRYPIVEA